ncbi:MAG: 1-acyl-sn-glycerol-3-phosphate acyltransferase [Anaerolineales bacterium]|jgi:1-acyl-sn-glycerol-3-phosphate acyltransferase
MTPTLAHVQALQAYITDEVFLSLGLPPKGWLRKLLEPILRAPTQHFAQLAASFDQRVARFGFKEAAHWLLPKFVGHVTVTGTEHIPPHGPLIIASNHPGTYDSLIIAGNLPRDDLKIIAGGVPFIRGLPSSARHLIYSTVDTHVRMLALRSSLRHLQQGGALLIFASGGIDPDPAHMPGAERELEAWSPSLVFLLRKAPLTKVVVTIVSGVLSPTFIRHPLTRVRRARRDRQRIAEFLQVIRQMLKPNHILLNPKVSFAQPLTTNQLRDGADQPIQLGKIITQAKKLLGDHTAEPTN